MKCPYCLSKIKKVKCRCGEDVLLSVLVQEDRKALKEKHKEKMKQLKEKLKMSENRIDKFKKRLKPVLDYLSNKKEMTPAWEKNINILLDIIGIDDRTKFLKEYVVKPITEALEQDHMKERLKNSIINIPFRKVCKIMGIRPYTAKVMTNNGQLPPLAKKNKVTYQWIFALEQYYGDGSFKEINFPAEGQKFCDDLRTLIKKREIWENNRDGGKKECEDMGI